MFTGFGDDRGVARMQKYIELLREKFRFRRSWIIRKMRRRSENIPIKRTVHIVPFINVLSSVSSMEMAGKVLYQRIKYVSIPYTYWWPNRDDPDRTLPQHHPEQYARLIKFFAYSIREIKIIMNKKYHQRSNDEEKRGK